MEREEVSFVNSIHGSVTLIPGMIPSWLWSGEPLSSHSIYELQLLHVSDDEEEVVVNTAMDEDEEQNTLVEGSYDTNHARSSDISSLQSWWSKPSNLFGEVLFYIWVKLCALQKSKKSFIFIQLTGR